MESKLQLNFGMPQNILPPLNFDKDRSSKEIIDMRKNVSTDAKVSPMNMQYSNQKEKIRG